MASKEPARLRDPDEHYPYKHAEVTALVAADPPAGPSGPDDDRARVSDFMSQEIADASDGYIAAQAAYLRDPGDATREAYEQAKRLLVAARAAHRANRGAGPTIVANRAG